MKDNGKMSLLFWMGMLLCSGLAIFHAINVRINYGGWEEVAQSGMSSEGSLNVFLQSIHTCLMLASIVLGFSYLIRGRYARSLIIVSAIAFLAVYGFWFYEKHLFLENTFALEPGSYEYETWLSELGLFRGGGADVYATLLAVLAAVIIRVAHLRA